MSTPSTMMPAATNLEVCRNNLEALVSIVASLGCDATARDVLEPLYSETLTSIEGYVAEAEQREQAIEAAMSQSSETLQATQKQLKVCQQERDEARSERDTAWETAAELQTLLASAHTETRAAVQDRELAQQEVQSLTANLLDLSVQYEENAAALQTKVAEQLQSQLEAQQEVQSLTANLLDLSVQYEENAAALQTKVAEQLQSQLEACREEAATQRRSQLEACRAETAQELSRRQAAEKESSEARKSLNEAQQQLNCLAIELVALRASNAELNVNAKQLEDAKLKQSAAYAGLQSQLTLLQAEMPVLRAELTQRISDITELKVKHASRASQLLAQREAAEDTVTSLREQLATLTSENKVMAIEAAVDKATLQAQLISAQDATSSLQPLLSEAQATRLVLRTERDLARTQVDALQKKLKAKDQERQTFYSERDLARLDAAKAKEQLAKAVKLTSDSGLAVQASWREVLQPYFEVAKATTLSAENQLDASQIVCELGTAFDSQSGWARALAELPSDGWFCVNRLRLGYARARTTETDPGLEVCLVHQRACLLVAQAADGIKFNYAGPPRHKVK